MSFSVATAWILDFQELDLRPGRAYQDVAGTLELDSFIFEFWDCWPCFEKRWLSKHCHQRCFWEFEHLSCCQTLGANSGSTPSKVSYVLCLLIAECSPGSSDHLPCALPSACRCGTWIFAHGDCYHLTTEEDIIPVDTVTQEAFSHHDVAFTSTPVLFYPDSAQPFIVKSNSSSQIAEVVLSWQRPSLFHECAFRFFGSSLQRHMINLDQGTFSYQHCLKHGNIFLRTTLDHTP